MNIRTGHRENEFVVPALKIKESEHKKITFNKEAKYG